MNVFAISVVIPIRNRAGLRLENCLDSLRTQTAVDPAQVEIILSDFGSGPESAAEIARIAQKHQARVVRTEAASYWNRSEALNRGLWEARAPISFCTDADMIFEPNFLSVVSATLRAIDNRGMVVSRCWDLPDLGAEKRWTKEHYPELKEKATIRPTGGTGACQATLTEWFRKVGGYDEKYIFWGFEDSDMFFRARKDGLSPCWIHEQTSMLHQYHPTTRHDRPFLKWKNKIRYYLTRGRVVKFARRNLEA